MWRRGVFNSFNNKRSYWRKVGSSSTKSLSSSSSSFRRRAFGKIAGVGATIGTIGIGIVAASDDVVHPHANDWDHKGYFGAYDTASLRRGYEVYRQVCSTCHSLKLIKFRNLVGTTHTEEQAKALAASYSIKDGPNDQGEMFERPGKLSDGHPPPYPNEEFARYANGGALPPDLSCVSKARPAGEDYVYSLLTGYAPPPAGVELRDGLHFNPYFPGGAISMAPPLQDEGCEYEDDTPVHVAQMAKDVSTFLAWASEPEADERKLMGIKMLVLTAGMLLAAGYMKRRMWSIYKTRRISYRKIREPYRVWRYDGH